ncbi:multifunctional CCA addition/repair protein [Halioxenophilus sp. WMMB6]|uniref:multifunctional CCA addition/repair protein n=1 Tax=Halioxenophilus sp. WMMB6 TaxID=3073815 RepID=UPI00295ECE23|nr:multifunctional CCA addition/repair protein [Halioxenophilus sp. WMMB6]
MKNEFASLKAYLVGGAVRDELLGLALADRDYVVIGALPEQLLQLGFQQVGKDFPVFLHPQTKEEYALARTERKSGVGYGGFVCDFGPEVSLEEDLQRRDLTINAIAKTEQGDYVDPYGGRRDLAERTLRHVSPAFAEDPLRVLRVARFAARFARLGFTVHPSTLALMTELSSSGELATLTPERVWKETQRALTEATPSEFFRVLRACGALAQLFPELDALFGVPQAVEHHPEVDSGLHVMLSIDLASQLFDNAQVSYAVLVHDLGKGVTPQREWPQHIDHERKGLPLVDAMSQRFKVPKDYAALGRLVCEHHLRCHRMLEMKPGSVVALLEALDAFRRPERVALFAAACEADARGRKGRADEAYPQAQLLLDSMAEARQVDVKPLLAKGYRGAELTEPLRQARISAVATLLNQQR